MQSCYLYFIKYLFIFITYCMLEIERNDRDFLKRFVTRIWLNIHDITFI
jgi:hypothetical protein